ncbi:MAG: hypothetical protein KatS3mg057_2337 [Herpetosiphonaceae bacterium]|nr:MAG: hypothetical protein KatS3mg057_2337 [Herpetosiphonaceae bacterium]
MLALVAWLHADLGQWDQAAAEARRSLELDVLQEDAHLLLGVLDMQNGNWTDAAAHFERALYLNSASPVTSFYLAECYRQLGRKDQAAREYRNTLRKLEGRMETELIDGVTVSWLRESCRRWLTDMAPQPSTIGR